MASDTREQLILAGERLFAERGIDAVSLRQVSVEAGQGNTNAVQYHFGNKDGLMRAVLEHRRSRIDARRFALLSAARASGRDHELRALVEAMLLPLAEELTDPESRYLSVLSQHFHFWGARSHPLAAPFQQAFDEDSSGYVVARLLDERLVHLPDSLRRPRVQATYSLFVHSLADRERADHDDPDGPRLPVPVFVADLLDAGEALVAAGPSPAVLRALDDPAPSNGSTTPPATRRRSTRSARTGSGAAGA